MSQSRPFCGVLMSVTSYSPQCSFRLYFYVNILYFDHFPVSIQSVFPSSTFPPIHRALPRLMPLDINLFRTEKGGNPDLVRESQRRRFADITAVDTVISLDKQWRAAQHRLEAINRCVKLCSKTVGLKMKAAGKSASNAPAKPPFASIDEFPSALLEKLATLNGAQESAQAVSPVEAADLEPLSAEDLRFLSKHITTTILPKEQESAKTHEASRDATIRGIGNLVHENIRISADEAENAVIATSGDISAKRAFNHVDLMEKLGLLDCSERVTRMSGGRAYVLSGDLVLLQSAIVNYSLHFLNARGYTPFYPPVFLEKDAMKDVAQLADFDEQLYSVTGEGEDKYLIATAEQPLCVYHRNQFYSEGDLAEPIKLAGYSSCFRKETGSHGRDTTGIFRVHQFDKIEQFIVCSPRDGVSWKLQEEMLQNAKEFYESLGIPYRVVDIVTGALNGSAARKYDLEAWFPGSGKFRELVSCSNCTDYQSRAIQCRYGIAGANTGEAKEYPHMLNSTLSAVTRTICAIVENHQTEEGVVVPEALRQFMPANARVLKFRRK